MSLAFAKKPFTGHARKAKPDAVRAPSTARRAAPIPSIQRKPSCPCEGGCPRCQDESEEMVQAKLTVNQPGDRYEQEADGVADAVMRMAQVDEGEALDLGRASAAPVQRHRLEDDETNEAEQSLRRQPDSGALVGPSLPRHFEAEINSLRSRGGRPLPESERAFFAPRFGCDFGDVRLHSGTRATEAARFLKARAFALGRDVILGSGAYAPGTTEGRRLLAHELTHVAQQEAGFQHAVPPRIMRNDDDEEQERPEEGQEAAQGEMVTVPEEQRRRFIEAFRENPAAALESIAEILERGAGATEVYGLVYLDTRTGEVQFVRHLAEEHQRYLDEVRGLVSRRVTDTRTELRHLTQLLNRLAAFGRSDFQQRVENRFNNPSEALRTIARVQGELDAGHAGYPGVTDNQLGQVRDVIQSFAYSHAFPIPVGERPRPSGAVLLGYFHSHPQTSAPSGLAGRESPGGDIEVAMGERQGSFMISGTPSDPQIFFIAEGRYWDLTGVLRGAIDQQARWIAGYDQALGGAFLNQLLSVRGLQVASRFAQRPGFRLSQDLTLGDYRLRFEGEVNPALSSVERMAEGPTAAARLTEESRLRGALEFDFTSQPYVPGTIALEYLSGGAFNVRARLMPWPVGALNIVLGGGVTVFEGEAGSNTEGYVEYGIRAAPTLLFPPISFPGEIGAGMRFILPQGSMVLTTHYQNPWFRLEYGLTRSATGETTHGVVGTLDYRLPVGTLQAQVGYQEGMFGSIGYRLNLPVSGR